MTDEDGDGRGERVREVASGLRMPSPHPYIQTAGPHHANIPFLG